MDIGMMILQGIGFFAQIIIFFICGYYFVIQLFSFLPQKNRTPVDTKLHSFAVVIAAHNESAVISDSITSIKNQNYPSGLIDIFIVADNCTDNTAEIARSLGATVLERFDDTNVGKGYAIEHAFNHIFSLDKKYEYISVFDADNYVKSDFYMNMNKQINLGYNVVQGYIDSKNPYDTWVTLSYAMTYWINNRAFCLARHNLDFGVLLGGTGFAVEAELLKEIGWGATCLAEDTEFSLKLALLDKRVYWAHDAVVYDEKPLDMSTSWKQRKRWVQGFADVGTRFVIPLMKKAIKEKKASPFHMLMGFFQQTIHPICFGFLAFSALLTGIMMLNPEFEFISMKIWANPFNFTMLILFLLAHFVLLLSGLSADKKLNLRVLYGFISFAFYTISWIPIGIIGIIKKNCKVWYHTPHVKRQENKS